MFSNIFFLILFLLIVIAGTETAHSLLFVEDPYRALFFSMMLYLGVLLLIYYQNRCFGRRSQENKDTFLVIANVELIIYLFSFFFIFGSQRVFQMMAIPFSDSLITLCVFVQYFGGLAIFYFAHERNAGRFRHAAHNVKNQLCFLLPFVIPFLFFRLIVDFAEIFPLDNLRDYMGVKQGTTLESILMMIFSLIFMLIMMVVLSRFILLAWGCRDLTDPSLNERLESLSRKANFKHGGFKIWSIIHNSATAAIIGIVGRFRYVLFTQKLIDTFSPEAIEAVLAHEMGHSRRKHLLLYPVILLGMLLVVGLFFHFVYEPLFNMIAWDDVGLSQHALDWLSSIVFFLALAIIMGLYFRVVFGYFSRLFERQADLYGFEIGVPSQHMIDALNEIAISSGCATTTPSWHHHSIQERIDFLKIAEKNPEVILSHHRQTCYSLAIYVFFAAAAALLLFFF